MLFAKWTPAEPGGLILTEAEAERQQAERRGMPRMSREAKASLLAARHGRVGKHG